MNQQYYTNHIRNELSHIQYDSKDAQRNAHYQLGLLISVIAQAGVQDNKIVMILEETLRQNPYRREDV